MAGPGLRQGQEPWMSGSVCQLMRRPAPWTAVAPTAVLDVTIYEGGGINNGWTGYRDRHLGLSGG
jgi:hypothetical protein